MSLDILLDRTPRPRPVGGSPREHRQFLSVRRRRVLTTVISTPPIKPECIRKQMGSENVIAHHRLGRRLAKVHTSREFHHGARCLVLVDCPFANRSYPGALTFRRSLHAGGGRRLRLTLTTSAADPGHPLWVHLGRKKPAKGRNEDGTHKGLPLRRLLPISIAGGP